MFEYGCVDVSLIIGLLLSILLWAIPTPMDILAWFEKKISFFVRSVTLWKSGKPCGSNSMLAASMKPYNSTALWSSDG